MNIEEQPPEGQPPEEQPPMPDDDDAALNAALLARVFRLAGRESSKPEKFGYGNFERWMKKFETCAVANFWDDAAKRRIMPTLLKDRAWVVYEQCADEDIRTYEQLVERLARVFGTNTREKRLQANLALESRRWRATESFEEYGRELERLLIRAMPAVDAQTKEDLLIRHFVRGLPQSLRRDLERNPKETFQQTIEKAGDLHLIEMREQEEGREVYAGGPWDKERRGREHRAAAVVQVYEDLPERMARMENILTKFVEGKESATRATAEAKPPGEKFDRGFRCGQSGHFVGDCTHAETRRCFVCRSVGHIARNCPERDRRGEEHRDGGREPARTTGTTHTVSVLVVDADDGKTVAACPTGGSLVALGEIGETDTSFLIDTGASISLCPLSFADADAIAPLGPTDTVRTVGGTALPVVGKCVMPVHLENLETTHEFWITSVELRSPLLGLDFMKPRGMNVDLKDDVLHWEGGAARLIVPSTQKEYLVALAEDVELEANSRIIAPGKIIDVHGRNVVRTGDRLIEPRREFVAKRNVAVARALVNGDTGKVPVQMMNITGQAIRLKKGTRVGVLEETDEYVAMLGHGEEVEPTSGRTSPVRGRSRKRKFRQRPPSQEKFAAMFEWDESTISGDDRRRIEDLLWEFHDTFANGPDDVGRTDVVTHSIDTGSATPVKQAARRIPHAMRSIVDAQIEQMVENGIVQPSSSPWASPIVIVRKKDGTYRFCVDYRRLNAVTVKDSFPLPRIDETFDALSGAIYFSTLDLASAYWQVGVAVADVPKTAFVTSRGLFEFTAMPFGLTNAPATFQRLMERVLRGLTFEHCLVYLDDILVFSRSIDDHVAGLRKVLERLREAGLKAKPSKCQFGRKTMDYLGHVVSTEGIAPQENKVKAVREFPVPKNPTVVRSFVNLAGYYRRFIPKFSSIAKPLFDLLRKGDEFTWTDECRAAMDSLKAKLTEAPILTFPRFQERFYVATDASNTGLGAVLFHKIDRKESVVSYASRTLSEAEQKYSVVEKEALGLVWAVNHFRVYLLGRPFTLITDHCPLKWLKSFKDPTGRIARWLMILSEYQWDIEHRKGREHGNADGLSRRRTEGAGPETADVDGGQRLEELLPPLAEGRAEGGEVEEVNAVGLLPRWTMRELAEMQAEDSLLGRVQQLLKDGKEPQSKQWKTTSAERIFKQVFGTLHLREGVIFRRVDVRTGALTEAKCVLVAPKIIVRDILHDAHDVLGHMGETKTFER